MSTKDAILLRKILKYINELKQFIVNYNYDKFYKDIKTINACVFNLIQIGELSGKLSDELIKENSRY